jgi:hypothetical protein
MNFSKVDFFRIPMQRTGTFPSNYLKQINEAMLSIASWYSLLLSNSQTELVPWKQTKLEATPEIQDLHR